MFIINHHRIAYLFDDGDTIGDTFLFDNIVEDEGGITQILNLTSSVKKQPFCRFFSTQMTQMEQITAD